MTYNTHIDERFTESVVIALSAATADNQFNQRFSFFNDGPGDIVFEPSSDFGATYGDEVTTKSTEIYEGNIPGVTTLRLSYTGQDSAYRIIEGSNKLVFVSSGTSDLGEVVTPGEQRYQRVSDDESQNLLHEILQQLKIANLHLMVMTDNTFTKSELP